MSDYSIWVLEYSYVPAVPKGLVLQGAFNAGSCKLPYCYVLIKGRGHVAMVDVGYNNKDHGAVMANSFNVRGWQPPAAVLAECGVTPAEVSHVFITHAHFDHLGGSEEFPNATFYLQERELSKWIWAMALDRRFRWFMGATDPGDIIRAIDLARRGRLVAVEGERTDVLPGIDLHPAHDTHTWGSMYVNIRNDGRRDSADCWIFAGDLIYSYANLQGPDPADPQFLPIGLAAGSQTNLIFAAEEMVRRAGGEVKRVIPIHDENLKEVFPSRLTDKGLLIHEIALAKGEPSRVQ
jgi:glyoxylase-like metal-dependent hydrolase (beta-lactamase superfamily II)